MPRLGLESRRPNRDGRVLHRLTRTTCDLLGFPFLLPMVIIANPLSMSNA